jgi:hypothetical protein
MGLFDLAGLGIASQGQACCCSCDCPCRLRYGNWGGALQNMTEEQRAEQSRRFFEAVGRQQAIAEEARLRREAERWTRLEF